MTALTVLSAEMTLRMKPRDELSASTRTDPFARAARSSLVNRPGSRASARRLARALLMLNGGVGLSFLVSCGVVWRSAPDPHVPGWMFAAVPAPILAGLVPTIVAAVRDRKA